MSKASREKAKKKKLEDLKNLKGLEKKNLYGFSDLTAYNAMKHIKKGGSLEDSIVMR